MAVKVAVAGIAGRMGREIAGAVLDSPGLELAGGFEAAGNPAVGNDIGLIIGRGELGIPVADSLVGAGRGADAVIDFTVIEASLANAAAAAELGLAMVIGTTGFSPEQKEEIAASADRIPVVLAPNMSVGVNVLYRLASEAARLLGSDYDIEIVEAHHRHKVDAPSGTALALADVLAKARDWDLDQVGCMAREGRIGARPDEQIGIQTVRAGDIVGEHTVTLAGPGERIELTHRAHSRANFARGAVRAATWAAGRQAGMYDMNDVLGLK